MAFHNAASQAQLYIDYLFSLAPQHQDLELIRTESGGKESLALLVAVHNGASDLYYIANSEFLEQLNAESLIGMAAFREGVFVLNHMEPFQQSLLKTLDKTSLTSDSAQAIPHWQSQGYIHTVYPLVPKLDHNYGFGEISAVLVDPKNQNVRGPYRSTPASDNGPLALSDLFGIPRL